jgi:recombination protein RecR
MAVGAIDELTAEFARLPGVGRKTASRLVFHLLKRSPAEARRLARAIEAVAERVRPCSSCGNLTEADPCDLCQDPRRDRSVVCVVEEAADVLAIERTGQYRGTYHVLGGRLSPLDGVGPEDLSIEQLVRRLRESPSGAEVRELIIATNPSVEGEATALYLQKLVRPRGIRVTRLARGLPVGGDLEYADGVTIAEALSGRREL